MRIMFMGTPDFSVCVLKAIVDAGHTICGVVTQPDKPKGRGHKMAHPPVYDYAESMGFDIYQPQTLKDNAISDILNKENPELIVVVAYGKILPEYVLNFPKHKCVNVHASLLPEYRGAAPIQRSIIDGKTLTGVTTMYMEKGLDTGDMIEKANVEITEQDNFETLHDKLALAGAELIVSTIEKIDSGTVSAEKQDDSLSSYAQMITKETARIDWNKNAKDIFNQVRGLYPVPKAFSFLGEKHVKITSGIYLDKTTTLSPGEIIEVGKDFINVSCGQNSVFSIKEIQPEGKRPIAVGEYLKGNSVSENDRFLSLEG